MTVSYQDASSLLVKESTVFLAQVVYTQTSSQT